MGTNANRAGPNRMYGFPRRGKGRAGGFTLLELVIATAITATVLMICYQILGTTLEATDRIERRTRPDKIGEGIMALLRRDLQGAVQYHLGDMVFLAEDRGDGESARDEIHFFTTAKPIYSDPGEQVWTGVTSVSYTLGPSQEGDDCFTLFRRESTEFGENPFETGTYFEIYGKVKYLDFQFFDGYEWVPDWDSVQRREVYDAEMENAIQELVDRVTKIPTVAGAASGSSKTGGTGSRGSSRTASSARGAVPGLEGDDRDAEKLLPLPNWGVPQAVRIELGILVGSERGTYKESSRPEARDVVYRFSATVTIPSALSARLTADVSGLTGTGTTPMTVVGGSGGPGGGKTGSAGTGTGSGNPPSGGGRPRPGGGGKPSPRPGGPGPAIRR